MIIITTSITIHSALVTQGKGKNIYDHGHHHHLAVAAKYAGTSSFPVIPYPDLEFTKLNISPSSRSRPTFPKLFPPTYFFFWTKTFTRDVGALQPSKRTHFGHTGKFSGLDGWNSQFPSIFCFFKGLLGEIHNFLLYSAISGLFVWSKR